MSEELRTLLTMMILSMPVGLLIGIGLRKLRPNWCKSFAKWSMHRKWWLFGLAALMFSALAASYLVQGRPYFGAFFGVFAVIEVFAFFAGGGRSLTPEMEARIDASDPTRLWPWRFWKRKWSG